MARERATISFNPLVMSRIDKERKNKDRSKFINEYFEELWGIKETKREKRKKKEVEKGE